MPQSGDEKIPLHSSQQSSSVLENSADPAYLKQKLEEQEKENAKLKASLLQQVEESAHSERLQRALFKISELASGVENNEQFYLSIHKTISELLYAENFYIGLLSEDQQQLVLVYFVDSIEVDFHPTQDLYSIPINKKSLSTYLFNKKSPVLLSQADIEQLEAEKTIERLGPGAKSWLGAPLIADGVVLGIIVVQSYSDDFIYKSWHKELFGYVSNVIASTLERKKSRVQLELKVAERTFELQQEIEKRKYQQETESALLKVAEMANSKISLENFYDKLHEIISEFIYAENFYIVLKQEATQSISFVYYCDTKDHMTIDELKQIPLETIDKSLTAYLFRSGKALLTNNEGIEELGRQGEIEVQGPDTISWLGIPLDIDGKTIGVMTLQSYDPKKLFSKKDKLLMEYAAKHVATAIQRKTSQDALEELIDKRTRELHRSNQQLVQQFEEKSKAEKIQKTLFEIASLASGAEDMLTFYSSLHQTLGKLLDVNNFFIALLDRGREVLEFKYYSDQKDHTDPSLPSELILDKNTLSYQMIHSGEPILISGDEYESFKKEKNLELVGSPFESWLGVPLKDKDDVFGVMVVQSYDSKVTYKSWHKDLLEYVSHQIAIALQRKQARANLEVMVQERTKALEKEIESRKKTEATQSVLYLIANLANMDLKLSAFYQELHRIIGNLVYCENFYIALKDESSDTINMVYYVDTVDDYDVEKISALPMEKLKKSITGYVMQSGIPLLATSQDILSIAEREGLELMGNDTVSWMGIPLSIDGNIIGIMALQSYLPELVFSESDKELMLFVGQHVATALQRKRSKDFLQVLVEQRTEELKQSNIQLKQQISETERAKKLQTALYEITDLASSAQYMDELYASVHKIISQLIYAENFYICLYDDDKVNLEFVYFVDTEDDLDKEKLRLIPAGDVKQTATGKVLLTGQSILRTPENREEVLQKASKYIGKESLYWLGVPLKVERNIIGVMAIQSYDHQYKLGMDEKELLEFVSQHIALTLERNQAQKALQQRVEERTARLAETNASLEQQIIVRQRSEATQAALYYIADLANKEIPLQSMFARIHKAMAKIIYSENFYIALWDKERDDMDWVYFVDSNSDFDYSFVDEMPEEQRRKTLARHVVTSGSSLLVDKQGIIDMEQSGEVVLIGPASEYYLGVPLVGAEGPIGVMAIQSYDEAIRFTESDQELLNFIAQSIISTIERREYNIKLEERVVRRTEELTETNKQLEVEIGQRKESEELQTALFKISETPQHCDTEQELYIRLHEIISRLMYAKSFYIALVDEEKQCFHFDYVKDDVDKNIPETIPIGLSLTSYVYRKKRMVHLNRKDISELEASGEIEHLGTYAVDWVGVPLVAGQDILGIMILQSYDERYVYGEREINILSFVSTHIAEALQTKRAEHELKVAYSELAVKTKKAEAANEAKSAFLATVSHEIRTPMNGILGMLSLLGDTSLSKRQKDYVGKISTSSRSLLDIINDILDFSKIEQGKLELESRSFSVLEILDDIVDLFSTRIIEKRLDFSINLEPDVELDRTGDSLRLSQILINLIGNSIKFTERGFIELTIKNAEDDSLIFSVRDSGIGIDPKKRDLIFASFTQADDTTTRKFGGSGLGLSICQQLVTLMDGWIKVDGELGEGSCFTFKVSLPKQPQQQDLDFDLAGSHILLITDDERQTRAWRNFCEKLQVEFSRLTNQQLVKNKREQIPLPESVSHIFIDDDIGKHEGIELIETVSHSMKVKTPCFLLSQPSPDFTELPDLGDSVQLLSKPTKMGVILNLIKYDFDSLSSIRKRETTTTLLRPKIVGKKILLAEDNPINQQVASEMLQKAGAIIDIVDNGQEAVRACIANDYSLVLMDMQMPIMDGYQASLEIRKNYPIEVLPIVAMTANVMKGDKEKCLRHGMNDYIGKPIDRTIFFSTVERLINDRLPDLTDDVVEQEFFHNNQRSLKVFENEISIEQLADKYDSEELAVQLIELFLQNHANDKTKIVELLEKSELDEVEKVVHKLKGSLGELGFSQLHSVVENIDNTLKQHQMPPKEDLEEFYQMHLDAIQLCENILAENQ